MSFVAHEQLQPKPYRLLARRQPSGDLSPHTSSTAASNFPSYWSKFCPCTRVWLQTRTLKVAFRLACGGEETHQAKNTQACGWRERGGQAHMREFFGEGFPCGNIPTCLPACDTKARRYVLHASKHPPPPPTPKATAGREKTIIIEGDRA